MYKPYRNEDTRSSVLAGVADAANQSAWSRFFDAYAGFIFGIARNRGMPERDADEIVQIVMRELCGANSPLAKYDRAKGRFRSWLTRLVLWRIANFLKRENAHPEVQLDDPSGIALVEDPNKTQLEQDFEAEWMEAVTAEALRRLRSEINPEHYAIFYASVLEGAEVPTLQRMYGVTADSIYQIRRRVGVRFRALVAEAARDLDDPRPPSADDSRK